MEESIDLQKPFTVDLDLLGIDLGKAPITYSLESFRKTFSRIDAEFVLEVIGAYAPELELQDELANKPLILSRCECAINGKLTRV